MVIVTGGAGFIGSNLVDQLIDNGQEVLVIDNFSTGKPENLNHKAKLWRDGDSLLNFFNHKEDMPEKVEKIFHLAAVSRIQPSFDNPVETYFANSTGTLIALEIARKYNARLVYAGSSSAYESVYLNPYAFFKWAGEECCKLYSDIYKVPVAIARFFNVYGPRQIDDGACSTVIGIWLRQYKAGQPLTITGDGEQRRDFIHVGDIVNGLIAMSLGDWNSTIFNLGTGINYSLNEVVSMFPQDKQVKHIAARPGEARATLADINISRELLGWKPTFSLNEYLKQHQW